MKTILVTGGAGYIGSHVCKALAAHGLFPVTVDSLENGRRETVKWGPLEVGHLNDTRFLHQTFNKYPTSAVIHLAGYMSVEESVGNPARYYMNNVDGTLHLLEAMRKYNVGRIVFSSSAAVYGMPARCPIRETDMLAPINPYGWCKRIIEAVLNDYDRAYGIHSVSLRYFNAAGADPDGEIGECHSPETHLIPTILDVACGRKKVFRIFGTDYETPDGTCIRDFVHVSDLASAHVLALESIEKSNRSDCFNLGNGRGFSVKEVVKAACHITGVEIPIQEADKRPGDPATLVCDPVRAKEVLCWKPKYEKLEQQVAHAWQWAQRHT